MNRSDGKAEHNFPMPMNRDRLYWLAASLFAATLGLGGCGAGSTQPGASGGSGGGSGGSGGSGDQSGSGGSQIPGGTGGATASGGTTATGGNPGSGAGPGATGSGGGSGGSETGGSGVAGTTGMGAAGGAGRIGTASGGRGAGGAGGNATGGSGQAGHGAGGNATGSGGANGPVVDRTNPALFQASFSANSLDSKASHALGKQFAYLDTRVAPKGKLVIYLHGADDYANCGNGALGTLVAGWGFHWFAPCYMATYGVENCGNDIEGCRLEALEGTDHHPFVNISRSDSIEQRIILGLKHLQELNPGGDWQYFLDGETPRWSDIVITGHSHGASSSGVVGVHRKVFRVVMLAGPYDPGQAWLSQEPMTPRDRFFGFSHTGDSQHSGHLAAWQSLGLPGTPTKVDGAQPPYGGSHRLYSSASVSDAHQSVGSGNISGFVDAWRYLYGAD